MDYTVGRALAAEVRPQARKRLLCVSLFTQLGILGTFKYFDFFIGSASALLESAGLPAPSWGLRLVLPVGVSFYTFQTLAYVIDVYRGRSRRRATCWRSSPMSGFSRSWWPARSSAVPRSYPSSSTLVGFDIERARDGLRQMLWGFFKKIVIADTLPPMVGNVFAAQRDASGSLDLVAGLFFFSIQIYCDFSGYSDIAIGSARLFGVSTSSRNFAYPYFARTSPSSGDAGTSRSPPGSATTSTSRWGELSASRGRRIFNVLITFGVSGLWHGANWTFVIWGLLNAVYYVPLMLTDRHRRHEDTMAPGRLLPTPGDLVGMVTTFTLTMIAWAFFRSDSVGQAVSYLAGIVTRPHGARVLRDSISFGAFC